MDTGTLSLPLAVRSFSSCLANAVPTALVPQALAEVLIRDANERLNLACAQGIRLEDIYIDDDCLPSWLGMCWDPEDEAPHNVVQRRLLETQHALDLGDLLQREIRIKSERKLREAQSLSLSIEHIVIGTSLLPEWDPARVLSEDLDSLPDSAMDFSDGAQVAQRPVDDLDDDDDDDDDDESGTLSLQEMETESPQESLMETQSNCLRILIADAMMDMQATQCSDVSDDDDDEHEAEAEDISQDTFMQNAYVTTTGFGLDERSYLNVIRGVEIVGGPQQFADVDLEVLLAIDDDDDEYAALPEVELAVDGEAFIRHFGQKEIVNVDIAGVELSCFDAIVEGDGQCSEDTFHETGHGDDDDDEEDITENGDDADEGGIIELGQIGGHGAGVGNDDSESSCSEED
ncbi:hypothetical protein AAL_06104 [Moelleriella libera RCEF 2490]|uniref:Uncharacterized protein n=1 Tax=Moelleriella libera RCEF 2490 TaxID=1081109 RepID=A0A167ZCI8_9HYPO|nr:hypothetical protein AAL_06104 [Moelleriella libera RCEF 2490]